MENLRDGIKNGKVMVTNKSKDKQFNALVQLGDKSKDVLLAGGSIMYNR
jgi:hypothetical protein